MSAERHRMPEAKADSPDGATVQDGEPGAERRHGQSPDGGRCRAAAAHEGGHLSAVGGCARPSRAEVLHEPDRTKLARRTAAVGRVGRSGATDRTSRFATPIENRRRGKSRRRSDRAPADRSGHRSVSEVVAKPETEHRAAQPWQTFRMMRLAVCSGGWFRWGSRRRRTEKPRRETGENRKQLVQTKIAQAG